MTLVYTNQFFIVRTAPSWGGAKSLGDLRPPYIQCFFLLSQKDQNEWKNENVKLKEKKLSKQ